MNPSAENHLNPSQFNGLVSGLLDWQTRKQAENHLRECAACQALYESYLAAESRLQSLKFDGWAAVGPCPDWEEWARLASGRLTPARESELVDHAISCPSCGSIMKAALGDSDERTTGSPPIRSKGINPIWYAAAAALVITVCGLVYWRAQAVPPLRQLAAFAGQRRSSDFRVPGAAHGPVRSQRGLPEDAPDLLEAEARIARRLAGANREAPWLHAAGRAKLLRADYESAVRLLEESRDSGGKGPELMSDLATAHALRGMAANRIVDYTRALEILAPAARQFPRQSYLWFNQALVQELLRLDAPAIATWRKFLALEPDGPWAAEARERLAKLEQRLRGLLSPDRDLQAVRFYSDAALDFALATASPYQSANEGLARALFQNHGDPWLRDLRASSPPSQTLQSALRFHAQLRQRIGREPYGDSAAELARSSHRLSSAPWRAWIAFENLYRASHLRPGLDCANAARRVRQLTQPYPWLHAQTLLESSTCEAASGRHQVAWELAESAAALARNARYPVVLLRAQGFLSSFMATQGRYREVWASSIALLEQAQQQGLPRLRLHQMYMNSLRASQGLARYHSASDSAEMGGLIAKAIGASATELFNWTASAEFAIQAGDLDKAAIKLKESLQLEKKLFGPAAPWSQARVYAASLLALAQRDESALAALHQSVKATNHAIWQRVHLIAAAQLALDKSDLDSAELSLRQAHQLLGGTPNQPAVPERWRHLTREWFILQTRLLLHRGQPDRALDTWRQARQTEDQYLGIHLEPSAPPDQGSVRLTFARLGDRYARWFSSAGRTSFAWLPLSVQSIDENVRRFRRAVASPTVPLSHIHDLGQALALSILPSDLPANINLLTLEIDGGLHALPFGALRLRNSYLADLTPILVRLTSRPSLTAPRNPRSVLVVANKQIPNDLAGQLPVLPETENEAAAILSAIPSALLLTGKSASRHEFERKLPHASVFHFAGHSLIRNAEPRLVLADSLWKVPKSWPKGPDFAFLAACSTAEAEEQDTISPLHLAHSFLRAGSRAVAAAQWPVDSEATVKYVSVFYRQLQQGVHPALALSSAARILRQAGYSHPYFWCPYILQT